MNHERVPPPPPANATTAPQPSRLAAVRAWARRRRRLVVVLAVVVLGVAALAYALRPSPKLEFRGGRFAGNGPMPVNVATAAKGDIPVTINALGTVTPLATVNVRSQVTGYITQIAFTEGQMVQAGDVLAVIDPRPYQYALEQAQGQLARDQAQLRNAQLDLERYRALLAQDSIAKQQVDTQEALVRQYSGVVQTDTGAVDNARLNLDRCRIRAPLTGRAGLRQVDVGNYLSAGDASGIVVITQMQPISVLFTVPEDQLQAVLKRVQEGATLQVTAYDRNLKTKLATGRLSNLDNKIDTATGTLKMRAEFENQDEHLFPNQFVNVELLVDTVKDATVVPVAAIQRGAPGTFVYVVGAENKVSVQPVKLGPGTPEKVSISSGLEPQAVVVTDGADRIRDGATVLLPGQTPPMGGGQRGDRARRGPGMGGGPGGAPGGQGGSGRPRGGEGGQGDRGRPGGGPPPGGPGGPP